MKRPIFYIAALPVTSASAPSSSAISAAAPPPLPLPLPLLLLLSSLALTDPTRAQTLELHTYNVKITSHSFFVMHLFYKLEAVFLMINLIQKEALSLIKLNQ